MSAFTIPEIDEQLTVYKAALKAVGMSQEYSIAGRRYVRADLTEIRKTIEWLNRERSRMVNNMGPAPVGLATRVAR
ncbi:MAG: hypothetical protein K9L23_22460 [Desulfotignum sp.]|nr:hypothetical protein [Desulfotignum sp.]